MFEYVLRFFHNFITNVGTVTYKRRREENLKGFVNSVFFNTTGLVSKSAGLLTTGRAQNLNVKGQANLLACHVYHLLKSNLTETPKVHTFTYC